MDWPPGQDPNQEMGPGVCNPLAVVIRGTWEHMIWGLARGQDTGSFLAITRPKLRHPGIPSGPSGGGGSWGSQRGASESFRTLLDMEERNGGHIAYVYGKSVHTRGSHR